MISNSANLFSICKIVFKMKNKICLENFDENLKISKKIIIFTVKIKYQYICENYDAVFRRPTVQVRENYPKIYLAYQGLF